MFKLKFSLLITVVGKLALVVAGCTGISPETSTTPTSTPEDISFWFLLSDDTLQPYKE